MDMGESGMNPVAMIIIDLQKENWLSWGIEQATSFLKCCALLTELWALAQMNKSKECSF